MNRNIIVIGGSAGGVEAVTRLLSSLPKSIPAAFFVTLHIPSDSESYMPNLINRKSALSAEHPRDRTPIRPGRVYVAPPDFHLELEDGSIRLSHGPRENRHRPAIDPMFRSAAIAYGQRVAGVLLTGNLDDGVAGLKEVQKHGGLAIVQDPAEAPYPEMPRNALAALRPQHCLRLKEIENLIRGLPGGVFGGAKMKSKTKTRGKSGPPATAEPPSDGPPIPVVCPECQGPIWELRDGKLVRFQCLVGHRYTLDSFLSAQSEELESALWMALRALEERINLHERLAHEAQVAGRHRSRKIFQSHATENCHHAQKLRDVLERLKNNR